MTKRNKIIYWIATLWLALGMLSTGVVQLLKVEEQVQPVIDLGYPAYFLTILGVWKIAGVIVLLLPKLPFNAGHVAHCCYFIWFEKRSY